MTQELTNAIENINMNFGALDELLNLIDGMYDFKSTVPMVTPNSKSADFKEANDALEAWRNMTCIMPAISILKSQLSQQLDSLEVEARAYDL